MVLPDGRPKGLKQVLEERGFDIDKLRAKCTPVCPIENQDCCMARLLSQQDDFNNQPSMLEMVIKSAGHKCIFLPKFIVSLILLRWLLPFFIYNACYYSANYFVVLGLV